MSLLQVIGDSWDYTDFGCYVIGGLQSFPFLLEYARQNQSLMQPIFTVDGTDIFKPTSDMFLSALKPEFSDDGSNLKPTEIDIYKYFCDYLQDLEMIEGEEQM